MMKNNHKPNINLKTQNYEKIIIFVSNSNIRF